MNVIPGRAMAQPSRGGEVGAQPTERQAKRRLTGDPGVR